VATAMTTGIRKSPMIASSKMVAADIYRALENTRVDVIYTPRPWRWIMATVRMIPERYFRKLSN
jgi:hypothetical protein